MTRVRLKHIRPMTFSFWVASFGMVFGLFVGSFLGLLSYVNGRSTERFAYIWIFLVVTPIVFAVISLLTSLIAATAYNVFVRRRGGMFFEFEDQASNADPPPLPPSF